MPKPGVKQQGRFVTLRSGQVIFIPAGKKSKWADVRDKIKAGEEVPLAEKVMEEPVSSRLLGGGETGMQDSFVVEWEDGTKALRKRTTIGSAESEVLAYELSKSIGWDIVPETVSPEENVSVQRWVEGKAGRDIGGFKEDARILIFDSVLQNSDRHRGNIIVDESGKQWAIDNDLSFPEGGLATTPSWFTSNRQVGQDYAGMRDAAVEIAAWSRTPAYETYLDKVRDTLGDEAAQQMDWSVKDIGGWGERVKIG